nr:trigger factor [Maliibacterium massiliense]
MASTMEKLENNRARLEIQVDQPTFEKGMDAAYRKTRGRYSVPGFRKGKAPRKVIENYYGGGVFLEDAFREVYPEAYAAAVEEHDLTPVDMPEIDIKDIGEEGITFVAEVTLKPEVTLGDYKGIEVQRTTYTVSDADIDRELDNMRQRTARFEAVEREAKEGDTVLLDYAGAIDGVPFEGGTAERQTLELGSGRFIPGFEEQVVGMKAGEEKDINVKFPEDYHAEELKGKDAVFHIALHEVKEKQLPALDDEFAKDISEYDTLDEYKASIRARLEKNNDQRTKNESDNALMAAIVENASVDIPDCMIERQLDSLVQELEYSMSYQGITMADYLKFTNSTMEDVRKQYRDEALRRVKSQLVLEAITKAEGIEASDEDVAREIEKIAEATKRTVEDVKKTFQAEQLAYMRDEATVNKTLDMLREAAVYKDVTAGETEKAAPKKKAPAKKTAAKKTAAKAPAKEKAEEEAPAAEAEKE